MLKRSPLNRALNWAFNLLWIGFVLFPMVGVLYASFQSEEALMRNVRTAIPQSFTLDNFILLLTGGAQKGFTYSLETYLPDTLKLFYRAFFNSVIISISVTALTLGAGAMSAYAAARLRYRWALWLLQLNVIARFVPILVLMIPLYVAMRQIGLLNTLVGVIIAETGFFLPFAVLILMPYFESLPAEMEDAARIDGCTRFTAFLRVVLPISTPGLAACGVIMFIGSWHDLLVPLLLNSRPEFMTLPAVLASMVGETQIFFNLIMATALLALLPSVVLVLLLQKYVVEGLSAGAVKG